MPFTGQKIPTGYARQLVLNYRRNKLGKALLENDTQGVWFSKNSLLEALNLPQDTNTGNISGLRIYLGAYEDHSEFPANPEFRHKLTLVLVQTTTKLDDNGNAVQDPETGFFIETDIIESPNAIPEYPSFAPAEFNDGQICPPPRCSNFGLLAF